MAYMIDFDKMSFFVKTLSLIQILLKYLQLKFQGFFICIKN